MERQKEVFNDQHQRKKSVNEQPLEKEIEED